MSEQDKARARAERCRSSPPTATAAARSPTRWHPSWSGRCWTGRPASTSARTTFRWCSKSSISTASTRAGPPDSTAPGTSVIVIGCGESGVLAGVRLKQAGIGFTILEKNAGPGGTWWENSYPGARVDVANHFYCYSFEPSNHWDHFFAEQPELRQYFADVVARHDLGPHIRFNTEVRSASWDGDLWTVDTGNGTFTANAVITAVGQLNRPNIPSFPGAETFAGPAFHSAAWDHGVDVTGKRVALIGAGASGFRSHPPSRTRSSTSRCFSAPRNGCSPTRCTTSPSPTVCAGPWSICPITAGGTGSCCCGQARTRAWTPRSSIRTTTIRPTRSARSTRSPGSCSPTGSPPRSEMTPICWPRCCPTIRPRASAPCRTTAAG